MTSSLASRNKISGIVPDLVRSENMVGSCSKNERVRTSRTTASRVMPECRAWRHTSGSTVGGRLSTTYQPRSSSVLAAVDRPAPDMPVTTTSRSGACSESVAAGRVAVSLLTVPIVPIFRLAHDARRGERQVRISPVAVLIASVVGRRSSCSLIAVAVTRPNPGTAAISSTLAARNFFSEPK